MVSAGNALAPGPGIAFRVMAPFRRRLFQSAL